VRILADTHALIWWMRADARLSKRGMAILKDPGNEILVSAVVGWEIAIKVKLGKIAPASVLRDLEEAVAVEGFVELPITLAQAVRAGSFMLHHNDPFGRLLAAQAQSLNLPILSADRVLDQYGVQRIW